MPQACQSSVAHVDQAYLANSTQAPQKQMLERHTSATPGTSVDCTAQACARGYIDGASNGG
jgi:hypothetical protein